MGCYVHAKDDFFRALRDAVNVHSKDNEANTPDYILADFLEGCFKAFAEAVKRRDTHNKPAGKVEPQQPAKCPACEGTGKYGAMKCIHCNGTGQQPKREK